MTPDGAAAALDWSVDVLNLDQADTGVAGIISISTEQWQEAAKVTWFPSRAWAEPPGLTVTLDEVPRVTNHQPASLGSRQAEVAVSTWVTANRDALQQFWDDGLSWTWGEVRAFIDGLCKLP